MAEWAAELDVDERMFMTDAPSPAPKYRDVREYLTELERRGLHQPETIEDLLNQTVGKPLTSSTSLTSCTAAGRADNYAGDGRTRGIRQTICAGALRARRRARRPAYICRIGTTWTSPWSCSRHPSVRCDARN